jgi:beta-exotoxin I transport system permease protein
MHGSIFLKTLRDLQGQTLAWCLGLAGIAAANVLLFPTVQSFPGLISFLDNMPPAFKAMVGDVRAMAQLEGFLRVKVFDAMPLLISIFVISQGSALIAGEIEQKSFDMLLARPVPRWRVVVSKFMALATASLAMVLALALSLLICVRFVENDITAGYLLVSSLNGLPLAWFFGGVALFGSCLLPRARQASLLAGGLVVASYVFETLRLLSPRIQHLDEISLFAIQKAGVTLDGGVHAGPIALIMGLMVVVVGAAAVVLEQKDLAA